MKQDVAQTAERGNRAAFVYRALRRAILEHALPPGTKLPEDTIGEQFGVSRTVVRRAFDMLALDELVEMRPNRGAAVASPSVEEARDLFDLRIQVELLVVRRLAGTLSEEQAALLRSQVAEEAAAHRENRPDYIRLAAEFHIRLAEMADSPLLLRYMGQLVSRSALMLGLHGRPAWTNCSVEEHLALIDALQKGEDIEASRLMTEHLDSVLTRALGTTLGRRDNGIRDVLARYASLGGS